MIDSLANLSIDPKNALSKHKIGNNNSYGSGYKVSPYLTVKLYKHQRIGYEWMLSREMHNDETQPLGGIIADQMGLGKTLQLLALILHANNSIDNVVESARVLNGAMTCCSSEATLIICPLSVMSHWENEVTK